MENLIKIRDIASKILERNYVNNYRILKRKALQLSYNENNLNIIMKETKVCLLPRKYLMLRM